MDQKINYLREQGVDIDTAIENMIDFDTYYEIMQEFYNTIDEIKGKLTNYKDKNDMPNYAIEVHALKSNVRSLGFMKLGDLAYEHELKSKDNDIDFVNNDFNHLIQEVDNMKNVLSTCINL